MRGRRKQGTVLVQWCCVRTAVTMAITNILDLVGDVWTGVCYCRIGQYRLTATGMTRGEEAKNQGLRGSSISVSMGRMLLLSVFM